MKKYKIIIIDKKSTMQVLKGLLEQEGLIISSSHPGKGISAAPAMNKLARFDILLPEECIASIFQKIHTAPCPPYFMMTARIDNTDHLTRMEKGIRDTIERLIAPAAAENPFKEDLNPESLFFKEENLVAGPISINSKKYSVSVFDSEIHLTPIEFKILRFLASNPEKVVTRQELTRVLYGRGAEDRYRVVDCHIARIRKKISRHLPVQNVIRSVYGTGYAFKVPEEV